MTTQRNAFIVIHKHITIIIYTTDECKRKAFCANFYKFLYRILR